LKYDVGFQLTDIAFDPGGGLWVINVGSIARLNGDGSVAWAASHDVNGMNALAFSPGGTLYAASSLSSRLYTIDTGTGVATASSKSVMAGGQGYYSRGDLAFDGSLNLYYAATTSSASPGTRLLKINQEYLYSSTAIGSSIAGTANIYGLTMADNVLYGVAGRTIYSIDTVTGAGTALFTYDATVLGEAAGMVSYGATSVPVPPALLLLGSVLSMGRSGRQMRSVDVPSGRACQQGRPLPQPLALEKEIRLHPRLSMLDKPCLDEVDEEVYLSYRCGHRAGRQVEELYCLAVCHFHHSPPDIDAITIRQLGCLLVHIIEGCD
jgi:hypothetical protein